MKIVKAPELILEEVLRSHSYDCEKYTSTKWCIGKDNGFLGWFDIRNNTWEISKDNNIDLIGDLVMQLENAGLSDIRIYITPFSRESPDYYCHIFHWREHKVKRCSGFFRNYIERRCEVCGREWRDFLPDY